MSNEERNVHMFPELARKLARVCASWVISVYMLMAQRICVGTSSRVKLLKGMQRTKTGWRERAGAGKPLDTWAAWNRQAAKGRPSRSTVWGTLVLMVQAAQLSTVWKQPQVEIAVRGYCPALWETGIRFWWGFGDLCPQKVFNINRIFFRGRCVMLHRT